MAVTTEDVQEWVKLAWGQSSSLSPLPLVNGFAPESTTAALYTEFKVQDGNPSFNAGAAYVQEFTLELRTWDQSGAADLGGIKQAIEAAFQQQVHQNIALPSGRTLQLLHSLKLPGNIDEDPAAQRGQAVMVSLDRYGVLCQG